MRDESDYIVHNKKQIINYLSLLLKLKSLISVNFNETETFLTSLISIEPKQDQILFDSAPKDYLNKRLLNAVNVEFGTEVSGVKVAFPGQGIKQVNYFGELVFSMPLPKSILWRQRREFYRVNLSLSKPNFLKLTIADEPDAYLPIYDISISGFSVVDEFGKLARLYETNREFKGCRLILEDALNEEINFTTMNCLELNPGQQGSAQKVGCKFMSLRPAAEAVLQRFIQQQERDNIIKKAEDYDLLKPIIKEL